MPNTFRKSLNIFLCHCSEDKPVVRKLYDLLLESGYDPWLDEKKLLPGHNWNLEIQRAIRSAGVVIVVLSKNSVSKEGYVQKELKMALDIVDEKPEGTIFLIPLLLDDCVIPDRLKFLHYVDRKNSDGKEKLLTALDLRACSIEKNRLPLQRPVLPLNNLPVPNPAKEKPVSQKKSQDEINKNKKNAERLNFLGVRVVGSISGFLAALTIRAVSDSYYQPNDYSILSTIAQLIAKSDFIFVLLSLFAIIGSVWIVNYLDSESLKDIEPSIWLRYFISIFAGYLGGGLVDVMFIFVLPLAIVIVIALGSWIFQLLGPFLGSSGGDSSPPTLDKTNQNNEQPKSPKLYSFGNVEKSDQKNTSGFRTFGEHLPNRTSQSGFRTLGATNKNQLILFPGSNCIQCNGTGVEICFACQGKGARLGGRNCFICNGSGTQKCHICDGSGKV